MNDSKDHALAQDEDVHTEVTPPEPSAPSLIRYLRRLGCALLLAVWFTVLLLPCALIVLATKGEIVVAQGGLPGQYIRVWLVMEEDQRGLGISSTSAVRSEGAECLQTGVNYVLWQGSAESATYCDCFTRSGESEAWNLLETYNGACTGTTRPRGDG
jgi:hypothetical protein